MRWPWVVIQPAGAWRDSRCMATAGKSDDYRDATGWDWYQLQAQLSRVCQENGIAVVVRKGGEGKITKVKAAGSDCVAVGCGE